MSDPNQNNRSYMELLEDLDLDDINVDFFGVELEDPLRQVDSGINGETEDLSISCENNNSRSGVEDVSSSGGQVKASSATDGIGSNISRKEKKLKKQIFEMRKIEFIRKNIEALKRKAERGVYKEKKYFGFGESKTLSGSKSKNKKI